MDQIFRLRRAKK